MAEGQGRAEEQGRSVFVVYNRTLPESREVAEHYAKKRSVPASQLLGLDLSQAEAVTREQFEQSLQRPLWTELKRRGLLTTAEPPPPGPAPDRSPVVAAKIRFLALCYGVPVKITPDTLRKEEIAEQLPPALRRNEAAVDSELAVLPMLDLNLPLAGYINNPVFSTTNRESIHPTNGILMVARLDGPTPKIARGLVDQAIEAEKNGLWGRAYFDVRGLTNSPFKLGDDWIRGAAEAAKRYGFETVVDNQPATFAPSVPLSDLALYFGWYDPGVSGPFSHRMAQFRPGAIAYHLHSFSSRTLRAGHAWWTGPLLQAGAAATMGCTEEPYLQSTPQVNVFLSRLLFLGFSFAEAAYASQPHLSWQITVIGDPLYRPFAISQKERYAQLEAKRDPDIEWSMLMWINLRLAAGPIEPLLQYYRDNPETRKSAVLQEKLGDIYRSSGKLMEAIEPYQAAWKLDMQPLQRLRVGLAAASLMGMYGRPGEAYEIYRRLLRENPGYPNKKFLYEKLAETARRLEKTGDAAEYERLARELDKEPS